MELMKFDMAGGAAALAAMQAIGELGLPLHVAALIPATENLPGGRATKPGDILTALNGKTIEIVNTDAEGRLMLADALSYAQRLNPSALVDLATLTGAIYVSLGRTAAGLFCNDDALATELESAAQRSGERVWRLPVWDEYRDLIKSDVADVRNSSGESPAPAGSIMGAKFLQEFVSYAWAHLDIAGVAWGNKKEASSASGASGFGVRLLSEWLMQRASHKGWQAAG
jgi:leucyl aminopeptidase